MSPLLWPLSYPAARSKFSDVVRSGRCLSSRVLRAVLGVPVRTAAAGAVAWL